MNVACVDQIQNYKILSITITITLNTSAQINYSHEKSESLFIYLSYNLFTILYLQLQKTNYVFLESIKKVLTEFSIAVNYLCLILSNN